MTNVIFSFVMGLVIATFGMYGRVSSKLSHDNPYWQRRHPEQAAREREAAAALPDAERVGHTLPAGQGPERTMRASRSSAGRPPRTGMR